MAYWKVHGSKKLSDELTENITADHARLRILHSQ